MPVGRLALAGLGRRAFGPVGMIGKSALRERFLRDSLEIPRPRTPQRRIYYTCMNYWMQLGLLRDLLHLHELVNGNLAFISDRRVRFF